MKRKFLKVFMALYCIFSVHSQGVMLVEDLTAIAAAIENGLTMYNNLMTTIEQYQRTCEQIRMKVKEMKDFDWKSMDPTKLDSFLGTINSFMDLQDDLDHLINAKNMKIGDYSFSLSDTYQSDFLLNCLTESERKLDPRNISTSDQKNFISRHGMTVDHYMKFINLEKEIETKSQEMSITMDKVKENSKAISDVVSSMPLETGGEKETLDAMNVQANATTQELILQTHVLVDMAETCKNIAEYFMLEHKLNVMDQQKMNNAKERFDATYHNASLVSDRNGDYLHLWGTGTNYSGDRRIPKD